MRNSNPASTNDNRQVLCKEVRRVTLGGLGINLLLSAMKLAAGILGGSQAMVADAVHSLSDAVTDVAVLLGVGFWSAPPDDRHPYGHWRIETLVTTSIGLALIAVAVGIGFNSIVNIRVDHSAAPAGYALWAAILSIVVKELLYQWTAFTGRKIGSSAVIANAWHHRSDALSSIPAAAAILIARVKPEWAYVDHIGAIVVSGFVLHAAWGIIKSAAGDLIDEGAPAPLLQKIRAICESVTGVTSIHAIRTRKVGPGYHLDLHVLVPSDYSVKKGHDISRDLKHQVLTKIPEVRDVIAHIEPDDES